MENNAKRIISVFEKLMSDCLIRVMNKIATLQFMAYQTNRRFLPITALELFIICEWTYKLYNIHVCINKTV